ncbi:hypothetical protein NVP1017O_29 [Vibrio phage 1.017.O._10N.286.55.C11]|nr:hypothetical protein NVP1017O_29 [Vibrio phage 1.017.O._10N.286.55.C11]AUR85461.1 hypothetical protein NVP1075O_29 [Vibrio phage 1.075.O._10N.286.55.B10]AUR87007.1 hypothetical protein NVP1093O_29 [Vibrio phage 1.093.O._10N.286.55.E10]AUR87080.1 hypothetical protein NVP1094O_29 [Vibrio phage 1.094.O._10N.286.55.E12]AUR95136.1 hypothetical protein NVP1201B_31 [Vibrio phage 1.201.B._10N.286.55.F1]
MQSMSLITLSHLSTEFLYEIISSTKYDEETKLLARRVVNSRAC